MAPDKPVVASDFRFTNYEMPFDDGRLKLNS